jgi:integrase
MSRKLSQTTADFLSWPEAMNLIRNLYDNNKYRFSLLIAFGCFWGLRISDILKLRYIDVLDKAEFTLTEGKTKKLREIKINSQLKRHIRICREAIKPGSLEEPIFLSQKGTVYSIQRINIIMKDFKALYKIKIKNFSSHSLRKTFGRAVFEKSGNNAELALIKLSQLFNHSNPSITRRYLGIAREELLQTYDILSF